MCIFDKVYFMIMQFIKDYLTALTALTVEMAPYLLLGFLIAGILHAYFPANSVNKFMGGKNLKSVINASLFGIPLPLCSCGVIPTGISFYKNGAAKGPVNSFFISTPQTGVDSILVTYSMLGLPMAIIRPVIALVTGVFGGLLTNKLDNETIEVNSVSTDEVHFDRKNAFSKMMNYAFVTFLEDIAKWLVIGLLLAALISVALPDDFFTAHVDNEYLSLAIVLLASIPLYVCATSSVPIAAVLIAKGLSPGAAIVFLMAGPATNAATMTVIGNVMGRKALISYLVSIILGAVAFGIVVNEFLPRSWFTDYVLNLGGHAHGSHFLPDWVSVAAAIILVGLIINTFRIRYQSKFSNTKTNQENLTSNNTSNMDQKTVIVKGMTCNHCKANVENNLSAIEGIKHIEIDLGSSKVKITGDKVDLNNVRKTVESIGYQYAGEA